MKLPLTFLALAVSITACSSDSESGPLVGMFGGQSMNISATPNATVITLTCGASITVHHPILLDAAGKFSIVDSLRGNLGGGATDTLPGQSSHSPAQAVEIDGQISGDVLSISLIIDLTTGPVALPLTFTATRGQPGNFYEICRS